MLPLASISTTIRRGPTSLVAERIRTGLPRNSPLKLLVETLATGWPASMTLAITVRRRQGVSCASASSSSPAATMHGSTSVCLRKIVFHRRT